MGAVIEETKHIRTFKPKTKEFEEKIEKIKRLEAEVEKLKEEVIKSEEEKILIKILENFPELNVQDLKVYQVYVEVEKTIEDFEVAVLTIDDEDYAVLIESYCEYIDPEEEFIYFGNNFRFEFGDDLADEIAKLIYEEILNVYRELRIIY